MCCVHKINHRSANIQRHSEGSHHSVTSSFSCCHHSHGWIRALEAQIHTVFTRSVQTHFIVYSSLSCIPTVEPGSHLFMQQRPISLTVFKVVGVCNEHDGSSLFCCDAAICWLQLLAAAGCIRIPGSGSEALRCGPLHHPHSDRY